jgi:hypothetical protein
MLAACGDGGGPRYREVSRGEIEGNWMCQLTDTAGCAGSSFEHGTVATSLVFYPEATAWWFTDEANSRWSSGNLEGWVSGSFPHYAPGTALLNFVSGPTQLFKFAGDLTDQLALRGRLTDSVPLLSPNPCIYRARGSRVP